jgi:Domain of unknown function (DUF2760)
VPEPEIERTLPLFTRLWFAWACFLRVLLDGAFAARAWEARFALGGPRPPQTPREPTALPPPSAPPRAPPEGNGGETPALQLLALFQREGRLVDFLEQEVASFSDADIGAVARIVHEGCRRALHDHAKLVPVRDEDEGASVTLAAGFDPAEIKLSGNVQGAAPYKGVLRHRGWRATGMKMPVPVEGHDPTVIAPAEVEL